MRGRRGVEEKVIAAIRKIRAAGLLVYVAGNVDRVTVAGLMETYELMRTLDIQALAPRRAVVDGELEGRRD